MLGKETWTRKGEAPFHTRERGGCFSEVTDIQERKPLETGLPRGKESRRCDFFEKRSDGTASKKHCTGCIHMMKDRRKALEKARERAVHTISIVEDEVQEAQESAAVPVEDVEMADEDDIEVSCFIDVN